MLIVIEGIDGSGKTTQTDLLTASLKNAGFPLETISFPQYGKKSAGPIEDYLNGVYGTAEEVGPYRASLFFATDRYAASPQMTAWLSNGKMVIANRYVASNLAHQGSSIADPTERKKFFDWEIDLEYRLLQIPKPDYNIIMDIPPDIAQTLIDKKSERAYLHGAKRDILEADLDHLTRTAAVYKELAELLPHTFVAPCMRDGALLEPNEIHRHILSLLKPILS